MKFKVRPGIQVKHGGKMYVGGETIEASASVAADWLRRDYVTEVKAKATSESANKAVTGSANKAVTESANKGFLGTTSAPTQPDVKTTVKKQAP